MEVGPADPECPECRGTGEVYLVDSRDFGKQYIAMCFCRFRLPLKITR